MNDRDQRRYERATRVQTFGVENASAFAPASKAKVHFAALTALLIELDAAKAGQAPKRVSKSTLLDALTLDLQNIARTARSLEQMENGFAAPYRLPDNTSEASLLTHADAVLQRLEDETDDPAPVLAAKAALRTRFIDYELAADFVADLRADRDAITKANKGNQGEVLGGVENTQRISELLTKVNGEIAHLDTVMHNKFTRQPEKLRAWQSASRVERAPQREKKADEPPAPPAA